jgi:hypothetical protein
MITYILKFITKILFVEFIPMPKLGINGGDAIGICIPQKNINGLTWIQLKSILKILKFEFSLDVYDLYGGQKLGLFNIGNFKKNLLGN